jgi:hypothetical protein
MADSTLAVSDEHPNRGDPGVHRDEYGCREDAEYEREHHHRFARARGFNEAPAGSRGFVVGERAHDFGERGAMTSRGSEMFDESTPSIVANTVFARVERVGSAHAKLDFGCDDSTLAREQATPPTTDALDRGGDCHSCGNAEP